MKTANEWADMIASLKQTSVEKVPAGFLTVKEWAVAQKIDRSTAADLIKRSFESGLMEKKHFKIQTNAGVRATAHYKIIK